MMRTEARAALELVCPRCDAAVTIPAGPLVEGAEVRCLHCNAELTLTREWQEHAPRYRWVLVDPDLEGVDDERRAS